MQARQTLPVFVIHRRWLSQKCCVTAKWEDGYSLAIRCFAKRSLAEQWLADEGAKWLQEHGFIDKAA